MTNQLVSVQVVEEPEAETATEAEEEPADAQAPTDFDLFCAFTNARRFNNGWQPIIASR